MEHIVDQVETSSQERELVWKRLLSSREFAQGLLEAYNTCMLDPMRKLVKPGKYLHHELDRWTRLKIYSNRIWENTQDQLRKLHEEESEKMSREMSGRIQSLYRPLTEGTAVCAEAGFSQVDKIRRFVKQEILWWTWWVFTKTSEKQGIATTLTHLDDRYPNDVSGKIRERLTHGRSCQLYAMDDTIGKLDEQAEKNLSQIIGVMVSARRKFLEGVYLDIRSQLGGTEELPMPDMAAIEALTGADLGSVSWRYRESPWDKREREAREEEERINSDYWDSVLYTESHLP